MSPSPKTLYRRRLRLYEPGVEDLKVKCPECDGEVEVPDDAVSGEIVSCPDCGQEYEVEVSGGKVELKVAERSKEDWGE